MPKFWIAVASADHVARGATGGFMQVCHGKTAPLQRIRPGDWVAHYSPVHVFGGKEPLQAFTALGEVLAGEPYRADMGGGFEPFRRNVRFDTAVSPASIRPLLGRLSFIRDAGRWGYPFRYGLLEIPERDFRLIETAMRTDG